MLRVACDTLVLFVQSNRAVVVCLQHLVLVIVVHLQKSYAIFVMSVHVT